MISVILNGTAVKENFDVMVYKSDAKVAMALGCDGVSINTAIAEAKEPILMPSAMKKGIEAGRDAYLAGRMPRRLCASASSPIEGTFS